MVADGRRHKSKMLSSSRRSRLLGVALLGLLQLLLELYYYDTK